MEEQNEQERRDLSMTRCFCTWFEQVLADFKPPLLKTGLRSLQNSDTYIEPCTSWGKKYITAWDNQRFLILYSLWCQHTLIQAHHTFPQQFHNCWTFQAEDKTSALYSSVSFWSFELGLFNTSWETKHKNKK